MTRHLQRKIHVGCRELGLTSDQRRDLQLAVTGKASMTDMGEDDLKAVLKRLQNDGFKPVKTGRKQQAPRADLRLIHVLWRKLGEAGHLDRADRAGLNAFIRASFGNAWGSVPADVDMLTDWPKIDAVIQALLKWCERKGVPIDRDRLGR